MSAVVHSKVGHESRDEAIPTPGGPRLRSVSGRGAVRGAARPRPHCTPAQRAKSTNCSPPTTLLAKRRATVAA